MNTEKETMQKSLDALIDELFGPEETEVIEKAEKAETLKIAEKKVPNEKPMEDEEPPTTADENGSKEEGEEDEEEGKKRGRPEDLSSMKNRDMKTGESKGKYDASITKPAMNPPNETTNSKSMKKAYEVSQEDFELLQKAKAAQKEQELKKARQEQETLIKSAISEVEKRHKEETEVLKKSLAETQALVERMAKRPQARKSISTVQVLEKSFNNPGGIEEGRSEAFSKSEILDAAEELVKSKQLTLEQIVELEDTGFIYDKAARATLENYLRNKK